jgi:hypothetical protein
MSNESSQLWWAPSALALLAGIAFLILANYGNTPLWLTVGGIWFGIAILNFQRRRPRK